MICSRADAGNPDKPVWPQEVEFLPLHLRSRLEQRATCPHSPPVNQKGCPLSSPLMGVWLGLIAPNDEELTTNTAD